MKLILGAVGALTMVVLSIPLVFANGGAATAPYACGQLGVILDTIRTLESGGNYQAHSRGASAAGAYQYITTTWRQWAQVAAVDINVYPTADVAPPQIQDQVAGVNVTSILADHDNTIDAVPVIWYYPAAWGDEAAMNRVPAPTAGNTLTVRDYQTRWLDTYHRKLDSVPPEVNSAACTATDSTGQWALPVPRAVLDRSALDDAHHDYPGWDFPIPAGTPVYAITAGTVVNVGVWDGNWWRAGCGRENPPAACTTCGIGITIELADGARFTYCHNNRAVVAVGDTVTAGEHIADSGDTGRSGTPHVHLEVRVDGVRRCPQPLLAAIFDNAPIPAPASLPTSGCTF